MSDADELLKELAAQSERAAELLLAESEQLMAEVDKLLADEAGRQDAIQALAKASSEAADKLMGDRA